MRIFHDRFVNFNVKPRLTEADQAALDKFVGYPHANTTGPYEGDAAIGWFQNNQSAYPTATTSKELIFENVGLRHQVFTDKVNLGMFDDGDKNTAIIDEDGTLTGFKAVNSSGSPVQNLFPISLNNLPINASNNAVDECLATGGQDAIFEGRPTSLISPGNMGTLEFGALYPTRNPDAKCKNNPSAICPTDQTQLITFAKDSTDYRAHQIMTLHGRNGQGLWEPKVTSGFGYTVSAAPADTNQFPQASGKAGIPSVVDVGVGDVVKPGISAAPFYVRLGICYTDQKGNHPAPGNFTITRGYKSYGGNAVNQGDLDLQQNYFNFLNQRFQAQHCFNLDDQNRPPNPDNLDPSKGCPANGVVAPKSGTCPTGSTLEANVCVYPVQCTQGDVNCPCPQGFDCGRKSDTGNPITPIDPANTMTPATDILQLTKADGSPKNLNAFYYDKTSGMLFFYVTQDVPNAVGPSPLGSCSNPRDPNKDDPDCPDLASGESYYSCPAQGCITYLVRLNDPSYVPGSSKCNGSDPTAIYQYAAGAFSQPPPPSQNQLVYAENINNPVVPVPNVSKPEFPHSAAKTPPLCPNPIPTP